MISATPSLLPETPHALATLPLLPHLRDPLIQQFRPPVQTRTQAKVAAELTVSAANKSTAARAQVLQKMGSAHLRTRLHPSLRTLSNEALLERFAWEFDHLQLFHNAPTSKRNGEEISAAENGGHSDDSPVDASIANGYLQNPCHRQAVGAKISGPVGYTPFYIWMGMPASAYGTKYSEKTFYTLRQANECLLFSANNLLKAPAGSATCDGPRFGRSPPALTSACHRLLPRDPPPHPVTPHGAPLPREPRPHGTRTPQPNPHLRTGTAQ